MGSIVECDVLLEASAWGLSGGVFAKADVAGGRAVRGQLCFVENTSVSRGVSEDGCWSVLVPCAEGGIVCLV